VRVKNNKRLKEGGEIIKERLNYPPLEGARGRKKIRVRAERESENKKRQLAVAGSKKIRVRAERESEK